MWLVVIGLLLRFTGQSMYKTAFADPLVLAGGISLFAGLAVFALTLFDVIRLSKSRTGPAELWLVSGVFWSIVAGASHLAVTVRMAIESAPLGYGPWNEALIYVALFGFISSFIFGVSARAIRGFLVLKPMYENLNRVALVMIQTGLIVLIVGRFLDLDQAIASVGLVLLAIGAGTFTYALRVLEPASGPTRRFAVGYAHYDWLVRTAYVWLVLGSIMLVLTALDDAGVTDLMPA